MTTLGSTLKEKRTELGLTLEEVSQKVDIQQRYLQALEDNRLDVIPGEYYIKDFVKRYATLLKLDGNKLLGELSKQKLEDEALTTASLPSKPEKPVMTEEDNNGNQNISVGVSNGEEQETEPLMPNKAPLNKKRVSLAIILVLLILMGGVYALFQAMNQQPNDSQIAQTSSSSSATSTSQLEQTTSTTTTTSSQTTTIETTTQTTVETTTEATSVPVETTQATRVPSADGLADLYDKFTGIGQKTYGLGYSYAGYNGEYHFVIQTNEPTWIRASVSGLTIYENTLQAGVPITITASQAASDVNFLIGISSAVSITMNDEQVIIPTDSRVLNLNIDLTK